MNLARPLCRLLVFVTTLVGGALSPPLLAQNPDSGIPGERLAATESVSESTADIMLRQSIAPPRFAPRIKIEREMEVERDANPKALNVPYWPYKGGTSPLAAPVLNAPQTASLTFDGATLTDTGAFPPDTMGTVGPTQWVTFVNGRIRTFTKAGAADGVINADPDVFFASVMTPLSGTILNRFTSDPQVRYDRLTARWFMSIIDVPCTAADCSAVSATNRWLLAVSNTSTITAGTTWTFFFVAPDAANFCDYPSLGIDVNALYFGCNMFSPSAFVGTNGYVVQKTSVLGAGPIVATKFALVTTGTGAGPYTPRGVDNFDPTATVGYFVGVDNAVFSKVDFRRVTNPGSGAPTISADLGVTVPTTTFPNPVEHTGNTGGTNGNLDSLDDRLFAATMRNGRVWTAHNIRVSTAGVASTATTARNAGRWYEFIVPDAAVPTLNQSGTVYDTAATRAAARQYWIPTITVTGQGHAVIGFTQAGATGATPAFTGRLATDALGSMSGVPGTGVVTTGTTTSNYNPPSDAGGTSGRRWGDYSFTVVDPLDDMTVWTTQEYNQGLNTYAARVTKLLAPPPATPTCSGSPISFSAGTGNVVINATSASGSGFYDPGANLPAPALAYTHISATMTNATVNSVTYNSPTQVTLNITANTAGLQNVTITNPDGQNVTANGCVNVSAPATFTIGGSVTGLTASGLVMAVTAGSQTVSVASGASSYVFPTAQPNGTAYTVSVQTQPTGQTCSVANASGTISGANVTNANVTCTTNTYTIGGSVSGLTASGLVMAVTAGSQTVSVASGATSYVFPTAQPHGSSYTVSVQTQPTGQTCTVSNASGTLTANVTNADVTCTTNNYTIGGSVSGLTASGLVMAVTAGSQTLSVASGATSYVFPTAQPHGSSYTVSVQTQPTGQTCTVANPSGTLTANVTNANVTCTTNTYTIGGSVSGLTASGLVMAVTAGSQTVSVASGATSYVFPTAQPHGSSYTVSVQTQPTLQTCTVANPSGTLTANVINANVTCTVNPPDHLSFTQPPANVQQGSQLGTVVVSIMDVANNVITTDSSSQIALAVTACGGPVTLEQMTVTNGVASFPANATLHFYTPATGIVLTASSGSLNANSTFNVVSIADLIFTHGFESCRL